jgi:hypothetical protein
MQLTQATIEDVVFEKLPKVWIFAKFEPNLEKSISRLDQTSMLGLCA